MSLRLHLRGSNDGLPPGLYKILGVEAALRLQFPPGNVLVDLRDGPEVDKRSIASFGFAGIAARAPLAECPLPQIHSFSNGSAVGPGDAIRLHADDKINVLYRRERQHAVCHRTLQQPLPDVQPTAARGR